MEDTQFWFLFLITVLAFNISPGPDVLFIVTKTIAHGRKIGFASSLGVCVGAFFHVIAAALGLSAILMSSAIAFTVIKYIGVFYLFFLAIKSFRGSGSALDLDTEHKEETFAGAFRQGILIDILNPKVAIFFMAFLPQFVREGHGEVSFQLLYLGLIILGISLIIEFFYILLAGTIAKKLIQKPSIKLTIERFVGGVFVILGIKLALSSS